MAGLFENLKKWINGTGAAETAASHQISEADKQEMKSILKASNGYLRVSVNSDKMGVSKIIDDGLRHDGLVYEDNSSGIQVQGWFNLDGKGNNYTNLYLEDLDPQMQKEIISAAREAFLDQKRNNIIEGGLRVFKDPDYNWEKLTNIDGQPPGQYRKMDSAVKDLNTLVMIQKWKENASSLKLSKSYNGEGEKLYVLSGKRIFTPIGTNDRRVEKFVHHFDRSNEEDMKFLNDFFNALRNGDNKAANTFKLDVVKRHFAHAEKEALMRTEGIVSEGYFLSKEARQVNRFNEAHDFQFMKAHDIPFMVMKDRTPTWEGTLNLTSYEHKAVSQLPDNLHVKGNLVLQHSIWYYTDDLDHTATREIESNLKELPDGLKVDGEIQASEEYLESLKTDRQRDMETITKTILERVKDMEKNQSSQGVTTSAFSMKDEEVPGYFPAAYGPSSEVWEKSMNNLVRLTVRTIKDLYNPSAYSESYDGLRDLLWGNPNDSVSTPIVDRLRGNDRSGVFTTNEFYNTFEHWCKYYGSSENHTSSYGQLRDNDDFMKDLLNKVEQRFVDEYGLKVPAKEEERYMTNEDPSTGMSKLDVVRDNNDKKIQELVFTATDLDSETDKYMAPNVDGSRVGDVIKELEDMTRIPDIEICLSSPKRETEDKVYNLLKQAGKNEISLKDKIRVDLSSDPDVNHYDRYDSISIGKDGIYVSGKNSYSITDFNGDDHGGEKTFKKEFSKLNPDLQQKILNSVGKSLTKTQENAVETGRKADKGRGSLLNAAGGEKPQAQAAQEPAQIAIGKKMYEILVDSEFYAREENRSHAVAIYKTLDDYITLEADGKRKQLLEVWDIDKYGYPGRVLKEDIIHCPKQEEEIDEELDFDVEEEQQHTRHRGFHL